ncbi:MAG TPA: CvpA family protein, partial [Planctomycetota bacterium]|nr:CvpA family protein [Planctomycetota bacterium]
MESTGALLAAIDWVAIGLCLAGALLGMRTGLGRSFALLLWLLAALWLGTQLSGRIVGWMPNTAEPNDPHAQRVTYAVIAGVVLLVPVIGRLLGGAAGKKKQDKSPPTHKPFGALVGLFNAVLFATLLLWLLAALWLGTQLSGRIVGWMPN